MNVVVDCWTKGNAVRFVMGKWTKDWGWTNPNYMRNGQHAEPSDTYYGDDWNDRPYQDNAGDIYEEFVYNHYDILVPFNGQVLTPDGSYSSYSKEDMVHRFVPCVIIIDPETFQAYKKITYEWDSFDFWLGVKDDGVHKIYFGDSAELLIKINAEINRGQH